MNSSFNKKYELINNSNNNNHNDSVKKQTNKTRDLVSGWVCW